MSLSDQFLAIDEEGFPLSGELRIKDEALGVQILSSLAYAENGAFVCTIQDRQVLVEAFDEPYVARNIQLVGLGQIEILLPYQIKKVAKLSTLTVDEWDRFHGLTLEKIPFVLSKSAQSELFQKASDYDDESFTIDGTRYETSPWLSAHKDVQDSAFWSNIYRTESPGWEMNRPAPALEEMLPRIKLPKSRVLVLGCGSGNDAAFFASHGHVVTAVDFSEEAISRAKEKYGHLKDLEFIQKDVFKIGHEWNESFDLVFEHTCYCAIDPAKRNDLIRLWKRLLVPGGQLMGVFFAMERRSAPPFGGTEWELRERLRKSFQFLFWSRWKKSTDRRAGKELFVLAVKRGA